MIKSALRAASEMAALQVHAALRLNSQPFTSQRDIG
jgi:hypothetical protein